MEIHPPEGKIETIRDFLLHLFTITCGILIALGLEGAVEAIHHHHMVKEARANILTELQDNRQDLQKTLQHIPAEQANLKRILALAAKEEKKRGSVQMKEEKSLTLSFSFAELGDTSWATAQSSGALSLMPYDELKRYTELYTLQHDVVVLEKQTLEKWLTTQRVIQLVGDDPKDLTALSLADVEDIRHSASEAASYTEALQQVGSALATRYQKELDRH